MLIQGGNFVGPLRLYPNRFLDKAQSREVPCLAKVYPEVVVRWLGNRREFPSGHTHPKNDRTEDLRWWSVLLDRFLGEGRTVFAYANNHYQNHSPSTVEQFL